MNNDAVQAIVVAPTRELAIQVSEELYKIGSTKRVRVLPIYGGQDIERQIRALKNTRTLLSVHQDAFLIIFSVVRSVYKTCIRLC